MGGIVFSSRFRISETVDETHTPDTSTAIVTQQSTSTPKAIPTKEPTEAPTNTPTSTPTPTPPHMPTQTPTVEVIVPTPSPTQTIVPTAPATPTIEIEQIEQEATPTVFAIECVEVSINDGFTVRAEPNSSAARISGVPMGSQLYVLEGPVFNNGSKWYKIKPFDKDIEGWIFLGELDLSNSRIKVIECP